MASRVVLIGCGGIGSQLAGPLTRYLASRPVPQPVLVLVDGDRFEATNLARQACSVGDLGTPKAEVAGRLARSAGLAVQVIPEHVTAANVGLIVREGDLVLLAVDNHRARALVDRHVATLRDATLISGGNDETDGNVQLVRRDGYFVTNLMVASAMLNALWAVIEHGSVPYSEVYLDVIAGVARPRRWIRLEAGMQ